MLSKIEWLGMFLDVIRRVSRLSAYAASDMTHDGGVRRVYF